jgi:uncharacterized protein (UPF0128 family)
MVERTVKWAYILESNGATGSDRFFTLKQLKAQDIHAELESVYGPGALYRW